MDTSIQVQDLTKVFGKNAGRVVAVDHVNFSVEAGEIFGFLGPNGAGKSTTQRMLTSLLEPTSGEIHLFGRNLADDSVWARGQIGLVPEESNIYSELTGWDNMTFSGQLYRMARSSRTSRAEELLRAFDLWKWRDTKAENYSKGMRRRLSIGMALMHEPKLLFLDEPTPGLDAQSTRVIWKLIRQLNQDGTTVFMTTHQIEEANQLCDRVAIINNGRIAAIDTPENLKRSFQRVQSVEVALSSQDLHHTAALKELPGVLKAVKAGDKWQLYSDEPSDLAKQVVRYSDQEGIDLLGLNILGPSLEDVFIELTSGFSDVGMS